MRFRPAEYGRLMIRGPVTGAFAAVMLCGASSALAQASTSKASPAPSVVAAPNTPNAASAAANYAINPGDELEIYVWGEERLQRVLRVLPDGTVAFPLVGQLKVQGLLPQNVEKLVGERLKSQYRGDVPNVTVSVRNPAGLQFSVMGKVRSPGSFTPGRYVNVLDAVSLAGGPAEFANMDNVVIIRHQGERLITLRAKLSPLFRVGPSASDVDRANIVSLMPGDIIIVP